MYLSNKFFILFPVKMCEFEYILTDDFIDLDISNEYELKYETHTKHIPIRMMNAIRKILYITL